MTNDKANTQDSVLMYSEKMLARLLEQIWLGLFIVSILAGTSSILRYTTTGWIPLYNVHLTVAIFIWGCFFLRHRLSFDVKVGILLILFYIVGIAGLLFFGLVSAGAWWLILCALIAKIFYPFWTGMLHAAICLLLIIGAGIAYSTGMLTLDHDLQALATSGSTWATLIFGCVFISLSIFAAVTTYQRAVVSLLRDMAQNQQKIDEKTEEINRLKGMLPICAQCKKIRDDKGFWETVESYIEKNSKATFSHCLCPDCGKTFYGEAWERAELRENENYS